MQDHNTVLISYLLMQWTHPKHFKLKLRIFSHIINAPLALESNGHWDIVVVRMLRRSRVRRTWLQWLENTRTERQQRKHLHNMGLCFKAIAQINRADSTWRVQTKGPNCWSQQNKLQGAKTHCDIWKDVLGYVSSPQSNSFIVLHKANGR